MESTMKTRSLKPEEFHAALLAALTEEFARLPKSRTVGGADGFVRSRTTIEVFISAKKDGDVELPPPCCTCYKLKSGIIICVGDCCGEVADSFEVQAQTL
jgi:hypothetical protein